MEDKFVLVACEESQRVCTEFRKLGFMAFSCDIIECSGGHPEWHIKGDVLPILNPYDTDPNVTHTMGIIFKTMDDTVYFVPKWDLIIAHPPCTYLTVSGNRWFNVDRYGEKAVKRKQIQEESIQFFMQFINADCEHIAVENPIGVMSTKYRKPDQIIQPWMFGDPYEKSTCLWLKQLPILLATNPVTPEKRIVFDSGKSMPPWIANSFFKLSTDERRRIRSRTFPGITKAMASQWAEVLKGENNGKDNS